jgi:FkbM family methyltransferase
MAREIDGRRLPVVVYGAGKTAQRVERALAEHGIDVTARFVDAEHAASSATTDACLGGFDAVAARFGRVNVVAGMQDYAAPMARLEALRRPEIAGIFAFDTLFHEEYKRLPGLVSSRGGDLQRVFDSLGDAESAEALRSFILAKLSGDQARYCVRSKDTQYFPDGIVERRDDEAFVDGGAYDGDTLEAFAGWTRGRFSRYVAFEPDASNRAILGRKASALDLGGRVSLREEALWRSKGELRFQANEGQSSSLSEVGDVRIPTAAIDAVCPEATFIKLDIEGAEREALEGARETIRRNRPKLAVCLYHRPEHLLDVPLLVKELRPDYRLHIRHHSSVTTDLVLYAV